jgi:dipeptidase
MRPQPPSPPPARTGSRTLTLAALALGLLAAVPAASGDAPDDCTAIAVGRAASADGSVMVSHTCDSHSGRTWLDVVPARDWPRGSTCEIRMKTDLQRAPGDTTYTEHSGFVPQVDRTHGYVWGFYPLMNEHQLAITESTFGGRRELRSEAGMFNLYEITRLMAERCRTAREAIALADELLSRYGYNDGGECLIIADPEEAWYWEVVGPGEGEVGVVWAARRVPDGHVTVNANGSRLLEIDPRQPDQMASENHRDVAVRLGLWDPERASPSAGPTPTAAGRAWPRAAGSGACSRCSPPRSTSTPTARTSPSA